MYFNNGEAPSTAFFYDIWTGEPFFFPTYVSEFDDSARSEDVGHRVVIHYARSLYDTETEA